MLLTKVAKEGSRFMKLLTKAVLILPLAVAAVLSGAIIGAPSHVYAHDSGEEHSHDVAQEETTNESTPSEKTTYTYVAQPGDSYSLIARKAVQTYGAKFEVALSLAQIMYAETQLTQAAGSPYLTEGQEVAIEEDVVKQWVDKALALTAEEQAAWDYYAQMADFNTDAVGEARS